MYRTVTPVKGLNCTGCNGCAGCSGGMGQSVSSITGDISSLLGDVFLNADGSLNYTAVAFAGLSVFLIIRNWGNTTSRKRKGKLF